MDSELRKYLIILGFNEEIKEVPKMALVIKMWRKAALLCHPDKGGARADFQRLQEAFKKVGDLICDNRVVFLIVYLLVRTTVSIINQLQVYYMCRNQKR